MRRIVSSLIAATAVVAIMGGASNGSAAEFKIKIQVQTPAPAPVNKFLLVPFAKKLEEESGGRIDAQV